VNHHQRHHHHIIISIIITIAIIKTFGDENSEKTASQGT
jgi:hypothetical protein